jgi:hypothetical protein
MAFVLIIAGAVLLVAAVRNTQQGLYYLLRGDFSGPNNFIYWVVSILIVGAIGYIPKAKPASDGFLVLILLVLFLKKDSGFFDMFQKQLAATGTNQAAATGTTPITGATQPSGPYGPGVYGPYPPGVVVPPATIPWPGNRLRRAL